MNRYDQDWEAGFGMRARRYGADFRGGYDRDLNAGPDAMWNRWAETPMRGRGRPSARGGPMHGGSIDSMRGEYHRFEFDRAGRYGQASPADGWQGYAPRGARYGDPYERAHARRDAYDRGYAREPFMPDAAYERHPEYARRPHPADVRWDERELRSGTYGDDELRHAVRESLFRDTWLDAMRIQVEVRDGVVTLRGEVDDFMEARYAWDDAWETDGVRGVVNQLTVRTDLPAGDEASGSPASAGAAASATGGSSASGSTKRAANAKANTKPGN